MSLWNWILHRKAREKDLDEEIQAHLRMAEQERAEQGETGEDARASAVREFGNVLLVKETTRDMWGFRRLEELMQDLRYGLRSLARNPGFTAVVVLTLALGIGGVTGIFSVIYGAFLNPLPIPDGHRLLAIASFDKQGDGPEVPDISGPEVLDYQEQNRVFGEMAGATWNESAVRTSTDLPEQWVASHVTGNFFSLLGVAPLMGRVISPQDAKPGAPPVAVLHYGIWQRSFGADPKILGQTVVLNGQPITVIGVMPQQFFWEGAQVWMPAVLAKGEAAGQNHPFELYGRLKPGVPIEQAEADVAVLSKRFAPLYPKDHPADVTFGVQRLDYGVRGFYKPWFGMFGAVSLLLLIACANVANLLLARATTREKEIAVRGALGASRGRLVRQFLVESLLLALGGAALGCVLAWNVLRVLGSIITDTFHYIAQVAVLQINGLALLFAVSAAMLSTLLFGLAPALLATGRNLQQPLNASGRGTGVSPGHSRLRSLLVVSEVVLALVLLTGAGLLMRSFLVGQGVKLDFNPEHVVTSRLLLPEGQYKTSAQRVQFDLELLRRARSMPGVVSASLESPGPPSSFSTSIEIAGKPGAENQRAESHWTGDGFFETMGIPVLQGRAISEADMALTHKVAVVNQTFVTSFLENGNPLGQLVTLKAPQGSIWMSAEPQGFEVVGVVADSKLDGWVGPEAKVPPQIYLPFTVGGLTRVQIFVRTGMPVEAYSKSLRREVASIDKDLPVLDTALLQKQLDRNWYMSDRFNAMMLTAFAALGLLLVSMGVYSVLSYYVSQRTHEIGVRMALGAEATDVHRMVMMSGLRWLLVGIAIGVPASIALSRFLKIWGIGPADPLTLVAVSLLLTAVGLAACYFPARRSTKVDPLVALRYE